MCLRPAKKVARGGGRDENTDGIEDPRLQTTSGTGFAGERW